MNPPILATPTEQLELIHPTSWTRELMYGDATGRTLGGRSVADVYYRKYRYALNFDTIWTDDFAALEAMVNNQVVSGQPLYFTYGKWVSANGIEVIARLSNQEKVGGSGADYYSKVILTLEEVNARS